MINCPVVPTALDRFMIFEKDKHAVYLLIPYTSINGSEISDKCMTYVKISNRIQFQNCYNSSYPSNDLEWELVDIENGMDEFLLRHRVSQFCLASTTSDSVQMINCSSKGRILHWKFNETSKSESSVFWKRKMTPKPMEMETLPTTLKYFDISAGMLDTFSNSFVVTSKANHMTY